MPIRRPGGGGGGGGGGSPGGANGSIQYNNSGSFGGVNPVPIDKGGTNSQTALSNNRVIVSGSGKIVEASAITASRALASDANGIPVAATTTATELGYVNGVTSAIQTQLNAKQSTALTTNHILVGASSVATDVAMSGDATIVASGALTIANSAIIDAKVSASAAIAFSKLAALTSAHILVGSAGNVATDTAVTGDVTISNAGVTSIGTNKVANSQAAQMAANTIKGNNTGSTANAADLTKIQATTLLAMAWYNAGNSSTAITIDWTNGPCQLVTLTGTCTITLSNPVDGQSYRLRIVQGASNYQVTFSPLIKWLSGAVYVPSSVNAAIDRISIDYDGLASAYFGEYGKAYA